MKYDATGVTPGEFPLMPEGWFPFRIVLAKEGQSKSGHYQITIDAECLDPKYRGMSIRHWVTFLPKDNKGAGMALHFLKCIDQPYEGIIDINHFAWEGKRFMGKVTISEYNGKENNKFSSVDRIPSEDKLKASGTSIDEEESPF